MLHWSKHVAGRKTVRLFAGLGLVLVGVVGLIMPIMPGWIFLIPGLLILSDYFPPVKRLVEWAKKKAAGGSEKPDTDPVARDQTNRKY